jgi:hypothetical protein
MRYKKRDGPHGPPPSLPAPERERTHASCDGCGVAATPPSSTPPHGVRGPASRGAPTRTVADSRVGAQCST